MKSYRTCFICLKTFSYQDKDGANQASASLTLLESLCRHVKFTLDEFSNENKVSFCTSCDSLVNNFAVLSVNLEVIQMRLQYSLGKICKELSNQPNNRNGSKLKTGLNRLRKDLFIKCSSIEFGPQPLVKLTQITSPLLNVKSTGESSFKTFPKDERNIPVEDSVKVEPDDFTYSPPDSPFRAVSPDHSLSPAVDLPHVESPPPRCTSPQQSCSEDIGSKNKTGVSDNPENSIHQLANPSSSLVSNASTSSEVSPSPKSSALPSTSTLSTSLPKPSDPEHVTQICSPSENKKTKITTSVFIKSTGMYHCPDCEKESKSRPTIHRHHILVHQNRKLTCDVCNSETAFATMYQLKKHKQRSCLQRLERQRRSCKFCGKVFPNNKRRKEHEKHVQALVKNFACDLCDKKFGQNHILKTHKDLVHFGKKLLCPGCKERFKEDSEYQSHRKACEKLKDFERSNGLQQGNSFPAKVYFRNPQTGKLKCINCEKECTNNATMLSHWESAHANQSTDNGDEEGETKSKNLPLHTSGNVASGIGRPKNEDRCTYNKKTGKYECNVCQRPFSFRSRARRHNILVHSGSVYTCEFCSTTLKYLDSYKRHIKICLSLQQKVLQRETLQFSCSFCGKLFKKRVSLHAHETQVHGERKYICEVCGKKFKIMRHLKSHIKVHENLTDMTCKSCKKICKGKADHDTHRKQCEKAREEKELAKSVRPPGPISKFYVKDKTTGMFKCKSCDMESDSSGKAKCHYEREHLNKIISCEKCGKTFATEANLRSHQQLCMPEKAPPPPPSLCDICGKQYRNKYQVKTHKRYVHQVGKEFPDHVCDQCGEIFKRKGLLTTHIDKVHLGKTFQCPICKWRLYNRWEYARHTKNKCANIDKKWGRRRIKVSEDEENEGSKGSNNEDCGTGLSSAEGIQDGNNSSLTESTSTNDAGCPNVMTMKDD